MPPKPKVVPSGRNVGKTGAGHGGKPPTTAAAGKQVGLGHITALLGDCFAQNKVPDHCMEVNSECQTITALHCTALHCTQGLAS